MDDPNAVASTIRQHYERWMAVANRTQPRETDARQARLERLEDLVTSQLKFTRADTQGNANAKPIKLLILEQAKLEQEIEEEKEAHAKELQAANEQLLSALHGISPLPTSGHSLLNPNARGADRDTSQAQHGSTVLGDDSRSAPNLELDPQISQTHGREPAIHRSRHSHPPQPNHSSTHKRLPNSSAPPIPHPKRSRLEENPPSLTPGRSIEFREIFQNGMDAVKYKIVEIPYDTGHCEAELHINIEHLAHASTTPELTIQRFGTRVLHCTAELARSNNNACKRVPGVVNSAGPQTTSQPTRTPSRGRPKKKAKMKPYQWESPKSYNELKPEVLNPQPGDIFACWQRPKGFYPVMIVPWGRFERFDFVHTLQHTGLDEEIPDCYAQAQKADTRPRPWAEGYENHGLRAHKRMYPVLFFDKVNFPRGCSVGWVPLHDLKVFDENCPHTLLKELVKDYLEYQAECDAEAAEKAKRNRIRHLTNCGPIPRAGPSW
ncbi:hypothetical protein MRS44_015149 [Fusarium solani]|uniref:uncharacterized protein n=1 Tax=Fusarium solani TaxID=169388 RepID=UPI0032C49D76|nr:hypothetical protein MRS44_015149 [Fusarium solani]